MKPWSVKAVLKHSPTALGVFLHVCQNAKPNGCLATTRTAIAKALGVKQPATVSRALKTLRRARWLSVRYKQEGVKTYLRVWLTSKAFSQVIRFNVPPERENSGDTFKRTGSRSQVVRSNVSPPLKGGGGTPPPPTPSDEGAASGTTIDECARREHDRLEVIREKKQRERTAHGTTESKT